MTGAGFRMTMNARTAGGHTAGRVADFVALLKPRPMSVVVLTALAGLLAAPGSTTLSVALVAMVAIALGGGGSAVLNMWFERDLDARMVRTASRPIPAGRVKPAEALAFALALIASGLVAMATVSGPAAAAMLALTILFYGVVYTMWLKRATPLNVVVGGGLASILTPLTGWAAATGGVSLEAVALFAFLVPWTPPHVWSQALVRSADYSNAGVPMMPVVAGSARTRRMMVGFTAAHALLAFLPLAFGTTGLAWLVVASLGGVAMTAEAVRLARATDATAQAAAWIFYRHNSVYVVALLAVLIAERALGLLVPLTAVTDYLLR
ncbi:MAG: protoheme IX farnesyltransferase [Hyphomicrobiaceae bacterium]|nr:protoheme IX farnesyltransferase [Hyphomicrobiaceae bacterium]